MYKKYFQRHSAAVPKARARINFERQTKNRNYLLRRARLQLNENVLQGRQGKE